MGQFSRKQQLDALHLIPANELLYFAAYCLGATRHGENATSRTIQDRFNEKFGGYMDGIDRDKVRG